MEYYDLKSVTVLFLFARPGSLRSPSGYPLYFASLVLAPIPAAEPREEGEIVVTIEDLDIKKAPQMVGLECFSVSPQGFEPWTH